MSVSFAGLPTSAKVAKFMHLLLSRSGELHNQPTFELAVKEVWDTIVVPALESGELQVIQVGDERWIKNSSSKMTKDSQICLQPRALRHGGMTKGGFDIPPMYVKEMRIRSDIRWTLNRELFAIIQKAALVPALSKELAMNPAIRVAEKFLRDVDNGGQPWFHICPHFDDVGREYGEGLLTYTGDQLVRNLIETARRVQYSPDAVERIFQPMVFKATGVNFANHEEVLARWEDVLTGKWHFPSPWYTLRLAIFYREVLTTGWSSARLGWDFVTSGPMLDGLMAYDRNLMADTNMFGHDGRDCRNTVASLVVVPKALMPWEEKMKSKDTAKPFVTQTNYGQGPKGAVSGMFWKDDEKAPITWMGPLGSPQARVLDAIWMNKPNLFNPDWIVIIRTLGWENGYSALYDLSSQYYNSFWSAYSTLKVFSQRMENAGKAFTQRTGKKPAITNVGGWTYNHHKWVVVQGDRTVRCRYNGIGCVGNFPHGIDVSLGEMQDIANPYSLMVRATHQADAWIRMMLFSSIMKDQEQLFGEYVGHAAVHDALLVPVAQCEGFHKVVRPAMHEFVDEYVPSIHRFLTDNGEEAPTLPPHQMELIHWSIAHHKGWIKL